jgi:hypothetical protein
MQHCIMSLYTLNTRGYQVEYGTIEVFKIHAALQQMCCRRALIYSSLFDLFVLFLCFSADAL